MHPKHISSSMMLFYHMQTFGTIFLTKMILIKLQWITMDTWHGIKDALMRLASATNSMEAVNVQARSIMKYG
jgi:hypothetical protein